MGATELETKLERIRALLVESKLDALLLRRGSSFSWATCGASSFINTASTTGEASLLITRSARYVITNNIEEPRLDKEEDLGKQGWQFETHPWYTADDQIAALAKGLRLGADCAIPGVVNLEEKLARLRARLTPEEGGRIRALGKLSSEAMDRAIHAVRPGDTEYKIASKLAAAVWDRGAVPIVNLVATDERVYEFRHPPPTDKKLERYAMLVLCARKWGLVCSLTRLVHFGPLPDELRHKEEAVANVDATFIGATRPGISVSQVFTRATEAYASAGFPDKWKHHHQGGAAGYEPREYLATPESHDTLYQGQAFAWNPSIAGVKSEDTILIGDDRNEIVTEIPGFPVLRARAGALILRRPAILVIT